MGKIQMKKIKPNKNLNEKLANWKDCREDRLPGWGQVEHAVKINDNILKHEQSLRDFCDIVKKNLTL